MRSPIREELMSRFAPELGRRLPQFQRGGKERGAGDIPMWAWEIAPSLTFFVMLQPFEDKDQFTVEIAWSDDGKFPWRELGANLFKIESPRCRRRLARLWSKSQVDPTWEIVRSRTFEETSARIKALSRGDREEVQRLDQLVEVSVEKAIPRVAPLVADAVQKLIDYGLPLFQRVVEQRGLTWPSTDKSPSQSTVGDAHGAPRRMTGS
jgi:hypothetical protein